MTTAPSVPVLASGSDSGNPNDRITNVDSLMLIGTGTAGDEVDIYDGATQIGSAFVDFDGTWAVAASPLSDGVHNLTAVAIDGGGIVSVPSAALVVTIDTTVLAPDSLALAAGSDSGIQGDGITNDTTPTITGNGEAGASIAVQDEGITIGTGTVVANGTWSITLNALSDGSHTLTATQTDIAGNISGSSDPLIVSIDSVAFRPGGLLLDSGSDSGQAGDNVTNVTTPVITGTGEADALLTLYEGSTVLGSTTVAGDGTWSVTSDTLSDGTHNLTAKQSDAAGNISLASSSLGVTIDTTPPAAPSSLALSSGSDSGSVGDGITNVTSPVITGTGEAGATVTLRDGITPLASGIVAANGSWSVTLGSLSEGGYSLNAIQSDAAGNDSIASGTLALTIVTTAPTPPTGLTLDSGSDSGVLGDGVTSDATPTITGSGVAGATVTLRDGGIAIGTATVAGDGSWAINASALADGVHSLTAIQTDTAGNASTASSPLSLTVDTAPPAAPGTPTLDAGSDSGTPNDGITNVATPLITGTGLVGATVTLRDGATTVGSATVAADGSWAIATSALADGVHSLTATQTDPAGNVSTASAALSLTIDLTPPAAPAALALAPGSDTGTLGDNTTGVATPAITGTGIAGDTVTLYNGGSAVGSAVVAGDGTWSITASVLTDGVHTLTAKQADEAGNLSAASNPLVIAIDTSAPAVPTGLALASSSDSGITGDGITRIITPMINGTGQIGATVTLYDGSSAIGSGTVAANGTFSIASSTLSDGIHTLTATQLGTNGNPSGASDPLILRIDTVGPAVTSVAALPATADLGPAATVALHLGFAEAVNVSTTGGTPRLTLNNGGVALYSAGSGGSDLTFTYTVGAGEDTADLAVTGASLNGGSITDAAGNAADLSAAAANPAGTLQIDTTAPAAPGGLSLAPASDSGTLGDGITNVTTPIITGTGEAGATVTLLEGATVLGSATVAANGTWSVNASALADGVHSLTATATDAAGNVSATSTPYSLTIDTVHITAPQPPAGLALAPASDSAAQGDDVTNIATPVITGSGQAAATVTLYDGSNPIGTALVAGDGSWTISLGSLSDGLHAFSARQSDPGGNVSASSATLNVTIDTAAPNAPAALVLAPASDTGVIGDGMTNLAMPVIAGTGEAGATLTLYDGASAIGSTTVASNGNWSVTTAALAEGTHALTAKQSDAAGNASVASAPLSVTIDQTAPGVSSVAAAPASGIIGPAQQVALSLGFSEAVRVDTAGGTPTLTLNNGGTASYASGSGTSTLVFDYTVGTGQDTADLAVSGASLNGGHITDAAGNAASLTGAAANPAGTLQIDTTAPAAPAGLALAAGSDSAVTGDRITNVTTPVVTGTGEAGATVTLHDGGTVLGSATVAANGTWSVTSASLTDGVHNLTATETDPAGNASAASSALGVTIDTTAPAAPSRPSLALGSGTGATPTLSGTGEAGAAIALFDGGTLIGSGTVAGDGSWSVTSSTLADGNHSITAVQSDAAGNASPASAALGIAIDTSGGTPAAPSGLALAPGSDSGAVGDDITNDTTPTVTGTGQAGATVTLRDGGTAVGSGVVASDGSWSVTASALSNGGHSLTATQTAGSGTSVASAALSLTIDNSAPAAPGGLALATGSDSGTLGDGLTAATTPAITGSGEAGATVTLYDGSSAIGSGTVTAGGTWSITASPLAQGPHSLTAKQTDLAGNISAASSTLSLTIDNTAPAAPAGLALTAASDSGTLGDNLTNDTTPTIGGTGEAGATVTLYDGSSAIGTGSVAAGGTWSITTAALAEGAHSLVAKQSDAAGNASTASGTLNLTIDSTAPAAPAGLALAAGSDSGTLGDNLTDVSTPVITGTGEAGATVTLRDGGSMIGSGTVTAGGTWSVTTSTLADGVHSLTATESDAAGNVSSASAALSLTIDSSGGGVAPPAALALAAGSDSGTVGDDITRITTPVVTGTGQSGATVTLYDGSTAIGTTIVANDGSWALSATKLSQGVHSLTAKQVVSGTTSVASAPLSVSIDTTAPAVSTVTASPAAGVLGPAAVVALHLGFSEAVTVSGGTPTLTLNDGGVATYTGGAGTTDLSFSYTVGNGQNTADLAVSGISLNGATIADGAGNAANLAGAAANPAGTLAIDTTAPAAPAALALAVASDSGTPGDDMTNVATPTITGSGESGATLTLYDGGNAVGSTIVAANGHWSVATDALPDGTHNLTARQSDAAGNVSAASGALNLTIDTMGPAAPGGLALAMASDSGTPGDDLTNDATPTITGTGQAGATVTLYDGANAIGSATVAGDGSWSVTAVTLADGAHSLTAKQSDAAGNLSAASSALAVTIDTTAPAAPAALTLAAASDSGSRGDGLTNDTTPNITGTGSAGATVVLFDGATQIGSATVAGDGSWSITASVLPDGVHNLTARQSDAAGNNSTASSPLPLSIDSSAPAAPAALALAAASDSGVQGDGLTSVTTPTITGTGEAGATVALFDGGTAIGSALVAADGGWSVTASVLPDGPHSLTAIATDAAGNASPASSSFDLTIDSAGGGDAGPLAPGSLALAPGSDSGATGDNLTRVTTPTITGTGQAGSTVTLLDGATTLGTAMVAQDGSWSVTASPLADGRHSLTAVQSDSAHNVSAASPPLAMTIDSTAPTVTAVTTTPTSATLGVAAQVGLHLGFSEAVIVDTGGGAPTLALNNGGVATYQGGSGTATLDFAYTVGSGQNTPDLAVTSAALHGAVITDAAGNAADLAGAAANPAGTLAIDTTPAPAPFPPLSGPVDFFSALFRFLLGNAPQWQVQSMLPVSATTPSVSTAPLLLALTDPAGGVTPLPFVEHDGGG